MPIKIFDISLNQSAIRGAGLVFLLTEIYEDYFSVPAFFIAMVMIRLLRLAGAAGSSARFYPTLRLSPLMGILSG